jgi:hypothetical protein
LLAVEQEAIRRLIMHPGLISTGIVVTFAATVVFIIYSLKKHRRELEAYAQRKGYQFYGGTMGYDLERTSIRPDDFLLLSRDKNDRYGKTVKGNNVMEGKTGSVKICIFDYSYSTDSDSPNHSQTVVHLSDNQISLPLFQLEPENFLHRLASKMGYQDIDFTSDPYFSNAYLLRGEQEDRIRQLFNKELRNFFYHRKKLSAEGNGNAMLFYYSNKSIPVKDLDTFVNECLKAFNLFRKRAGGNR